MRWTTVFKRATRQFRRRVIAAGMLACYALFMTGVPLPAPYPIVTSAGPFPCQTHRCGCVSAEQCWRDCCCFTQAEKLAWAGRKGISVPDFLSKDATGTELTSKTTSASCCAAKVAPRETRVAETRPTNSSSQRQSQVCHAPDSDVQQESPQNQFVIGIAALKCRGMGGDWTFPAGFAPISTECAWAWDDSMAFPVTLSPGHLVSLSLAPPSPPPRHSA